jgi:hypothetical protein
VLWTCPLHGRYQFAECCELASKESLNIRGVVRPPEGWALVTGDYVQQEYALAAIASGQADLEEAMLDRREDAHEYVMRVLSGRSKQEFQDSTGQWVSKQAEDEYKNLRSRFKCLDPATRVLCADLTWKSAGELAVGDELIGFDEYPPPGKKQRRYKPTKVTAVGRAVLPCYRVVTDKGSIVASEDHLWLYRDNPRPFRREEDLTHPGHSRWVKTQDLKPGGGILFFVQPWEYDTSRDGGVLAGFLAGEGCVSGTLTYAQNVGPTLDLIRGLLAERGFDPPYSEYVSKRGVRAGFSTFAKTQAIRLLGMVRPPRLLDQAEKLWDGMVVGSAGPRPAIVHSVEFLGHREVVTLGTRSRTLIAEGFLTHNSINFMILYRGGADHLARSLNIAVEEAERQIFEYYERLQHVKWWQYQVIMKLRETGRVVGLFKTYRTLPNVFSPFRGDRNEAERQACNFPFQNGGYHVMARSLVRLAHRWRRTRLPARVLFSVHDELVGMARLDVLPEAMATMREEMEQPHEELVGGCGIRRGILADVKACWEWGGAEWHPETPAPTVAEL